MCCAERLIALASSPMSIPVVGCTIIVAGFGILPWCVGSCQKDIVIEEVTRSVRNVIKDWPEPSRQEYVDLVSRTLREYRSVPAFEERVQITMRGLPRMLNGTPTEALFPFTAQLTAKTRWFLEDLMSRPLLSQEEKETLRSEYVQIVEHACGSLREQFPFLPEERLQTESRRALETCRVAIQEGFLPIFGRLLSDVEVRNICEAWDRAFMERTKMWYQIRESDDGVMSSPDDGKFQSWPIAALVRRCLDALIHQIWMVAGHAPEYCSQTGTDEGRSTGVKAGPGQVPPSAWKIVGRRFAEAKDVEDWAFIVGASFSVAGPEYHSETSDNGKTSRIVGPQE